MLEDIIYRLTSLVPSGGSDLVGGHAGLPVNYICSLGGALVLSKFTGSIGMLTIPVNAAALFIGAKLSSLVMSHYDLHLDRTLEQPMLATLSGMTIAALLMMAWMKRDGRTAQV